MVFSVTRKAKARWAMPVSLQPRAPKWCRVVEPVRKRSVPQSPLGFHVRPRRVYQVQLVSQGPEHEPSRITLVAPSSLRCTPFGEELTSMDGRSAHCLSFEAIQHDAWPWYLRSLFSRVETLTVHQEYDDGRDDYEHSMPLVISPTRAWVMWSLLSVAVLYFVSALINHMLKLDGDLPQVTAYVQNLSRTPLLWVGLASLVIIPWLLITLLDRLNLWMCWHRCCAGSTKPTEGGG
jgi:hypothetical protein